MKYFTEKLLRPVKETRAETRWLIGFIALVAASALILSWTVNLTPQVGSDFFFSSNNPKFQYNKLISKIFPASSSQIIFSVKGDFTSPEYIRRLGVFGDVLTVIPGVASVKSLVSGPRDVKAAEESPLWKRILISSDGKASNVIAVLEDASPQKIIPKFEDLMDLIQTKGFRLMIAGVPYVTEMIRRNLVHDLTVFSTVAFFIFGAVIVFIFRSVRIFIGTMIACVEACILTLFVTGICGIKTGILTVNLSTIVFVLTLSHIIFLTHNWKNLVRDGGEEDHVVSAVRYTFGASFWCMVTTLLGFLSLLWVQAKPLRELGIAGSIGTVVAIISAYLIYPLFLRKVSPPARTVKSAGRERARSFFLKRSLVAASILAVLFAAAIPGLRHLNTDPSLLSYFKKGSGLREGLEYIDLNGGSSPLDLVIRDADGNKLDTNRAYKKLWALQKALENDPSVGSVISLPILMAEGSRAPMAFMLNWESLLKWMNKPEYNRIARSFITDDHVSGHFILRMKESGRKESRVEVVDGIRGIVRDHGFFTEMVGGLYLLQGEMARLVFSSLVFGLARLIIFFVIVAYIVSRSVKISLAMVASLAVVPVVIFGVIGYFRIPVDIISAPAVNVAIGMGIDAMIHMVTAVRRRTKKGIDQDKAWLQARVRLWKPILSSMFIICAGFGIFALSAFPPTQRFGMAILFGTILATASTVFLLPILSQLKFKR